MTKSIVPISWPFLDLFSIYCKHKAITNHFWNVEMDWREYYSTTINHSLQPCRAEKHFGTHNMPNLAVDGLEWQFCGWLHLADKICPWRTATQAWVDKKSMINHFLPPWWAEKHPRRVNTLNLEVDSIQDPKTNSAKNRILRLQWAEVYQILVKD